MVKHVGKRGDTLIEVMLAVGIFSMVAIAVVAVMSGGTSGAQTALETTLAREEIDTQAEALRFIQSAYINEKDEEEDGKFAKLWQLITASEYGNSNNVNVVTGNSNIEEITNYSPSACSDLYGDDGEAKKYGFVINTRALGSNPGNAVVSAKSSADKFRQAATYPRLIYADDNANLVDSDFNQTLQAVEGIYIIAVKDPDTTTIAGKEKQSAYYDFYIRTCWYGTGDQTPSTISTVMRLYDPGIAKDE